MSLYSFDRPLNKFWRNVGIPKHCIDGSELAYESGICSGEDTLSISHVMLAGTLPVLASQPTTILILHTVSEFHGRSP